MHETLRQGVKIGFGLGFWARGGALPHPTEGMEGASLHPGARLMCAPRLPDAAPPSQTSTSGEAIRRMRHPQSLEFSLLERWHPITWPSVQAIRTTHFLESQMPSM